MLLLIINLLDTDYSFNRCIGRCSRLDEGVDDVKLALRNEVCEINCDFASDHCLAIVVLSR